MVLGQDGPRSGDRFFEKSENIFVKIKNNFLGEDQFGSETRTLFLSSYF